MLQCSAHSNLMMHVTFCVLLFQQSEMKIRLNNTKKGLTTVWSVDKFQSALEQMRELYQQRDNDSVSGESGDEVDPFNDPDDKWEKDFKLDSSSSRRISSLSSSGLSSRARSSSAGKQQGFSSNKAESIFAKYRNQQNQGSSSSDASEAPSEDPETLPEKPVVETSSRPPVAPHTRRMSETRRPGPSVSRLCGESLKNHLATLKELSDPFTEPLYEKVLRSVKDLKNSVTSIVKAQGKTSVGGIQKEVHQCCLTSTLALQVLIEHARIWGTSETNNVHFTELSSQLLDTVKRLAGHVIGIVETLDGSPTSNMDGVFSAFNEDVRHVVRHTAKMAVLSSQEEPPTDGNDSTGNDNELNKAFVEGQDMSMEISVRDSISVISEIQEQLQTDTLDSRNTEVEREIIENVLSLIRTTGDFIHQGREVQMQLVSTSNENNRKDTGRNRLISVRKFVSSVNTLLQRTRDLASNVRKACEDMDLEKLVSLPEEISTSAGNIVRQERAFIDSEYSAAVGNNQNILDEMEYLEKKSSDVELAAGDLRKVLTRFLFLSPPKSLQKRNFRLVRTDKDDSDEDANSPLTGRSYHARTPLASRSRDLFSAKESRSSRKLWSKESPI